MPLYLNSFEEAQKKGREEVDKYWTIVNKVDTIYKEKVPSTAT